ncbi:MAG: FtsW/RodA/SpoVE family cell cycle protein [Candidatus Melainabacteria bacterium]
MSQTTTIPPSWTGASGETAVTPQSRSRVALAPVDRQLLSVTIVLMLFGLVMLYSASASHAQIESGNSLAYVMKQGVALTIGLFMMGLLSRIPFQNWARLAKVLGIVALMLLLATKLFGTTANGSERWIPLPFGFQLQSSDFAKIAAVFLLAQAACNMRFFSPGLYINLVMVAAMMVLIIQQPNLSVTLMIGALTGATLFVAGLPWILMAASTPLIGLVVYQKIMNTAYQKRRIVGWLNPWKDPMDAGYNLIQSYYAIGSGGVLGAGLGNSIQKLYYLPFQHTDFIFAVICEELGFPGALLVLGLFGFLVWRGFSIALSCPNRFGQMVAFGMTFLIAAQTLVNIAVTVGLFPVTGVTLPLISYGGTSAIVTLMMIGILLNISRYRQTPAGSR